MTRPLHLKVVLLPPLPNVLDGVVDLVHRFLETTLRKALARTRRRLAWENLSATMNSLMSLSSSSFIASSARRAFFFGAGGEVAHTTSAAAPRGFASFRFNSVSLLSDWALELSGRNSHTLQRQV